MCHRQAACKKKAEEEREGSDETAEGRVGGEGAVWLVRVCIGGVQVGPTTLIEGCLWREMKTEERRKRMCEQFLYLCTHSTVCQSAIYQIKK